MVIDDSFQHGPVRLEGVERPLTVGHEPLVDRISGCNRPDGGSESVLAVLGRAEALIS